MRATVGAQLERAQHGQTTGLIVATDGLRLAVGDCAALSQLPRLPSGALQDDLGLLVLRWVPTGHAVG